jgi:hypothetical protein
VFVFRSPIVLGAGKLVKLIRETGDSQSKFLESSE